MLAQLRRTKTPPGNSVSPQTLSSSPIPVPTVSVVIPTKNEAKNLPHVLSRIPKMVDEVIIVDANSMDGTADVARALRSDVRIVNQRGRGKGNALREGFAAANGDIIVMLDADGSMAPDEIPAFVSALLAGADYAKGTRFMKGGGTDDMEYHRFLGNWGFVTLVRVLFGGRYTDLCYGYCAFWSRVLPDLKLTSDGFEIETEINVRALKVGLKITEVPSFEYKRIHGVSNLKAIQDGMRVLKMILKERISNDKLALTPNGQIRIDEFSLAMKLLEQEAAHLARRKTSLPTNTYQSTVDAIKDASKALLTMESNDPYVRRRQEIYQNRADKMWSFLDAV